MITYNRAGESSSLDNVPFEVNPEAGDEIKDPLESHRSKGNEALVVYHNIIHEIAPGEGRKMERLLDSKCEYLSFPHLFGSGMFGIVEHCGVTLVIFQPKAS